jgi:peptidoglycan/xylan/chitin deacetylase (PgdA/CDA1 family)
MNGARVRPLAGLKSRLVRMAGPVGLYRLSQGLTRAEPRILMYHRFGRHGVPAQVFREQLRLLRRRFCIVTLADLIRRVDDGALEPGLAVITVDDGYEDFRRVAFPILEQAGVPATFFVTTDFIDGKIWLWPDVLSYAIERTRVRQPDLSCAGVRQGLELGTATGRKAAWQTLVDTLLDLSGQERLARLQRVAHALKVNIPPLPDPDHAPVSWDALREMSRAGIEIGAHTLTHPRLTRLADEELAAEISGSKQRIEAEIRRPVTSFCYPNGAPADYDDRVADAVRRAGFDCAVVAHFDGRRGDRFRLRRLGVGDNMFQYRKSLAGIEHIGRRVFRRSAATA